jgi:hypothetical protein
MDEDEIPSKGRMNEAEILFVTGVRQGLADKIFAALYANSPLEDLEYEWFLLSLAIIKNDLSWDASCGISRHVTGVFRSERTVRRRFSTVVTAANVLWKHINQKIRFQYADARFPYCTAIVDGRPTRCRARMKKEIVDEQGRKRTRDETYSGKYRTHVMKFEVWTTINGIPFFFRGPFPGSHHDTKMCRSAGFFPHCEQEYFLADLGYVGLPHMVTPYKNNDARKPTAATIADFDQNIQTVRSRIERTFGWMTKWRSLSRTNHQPRFLRGAMTLACLVTYYELVEDPPMYRTIGCELDFGRVTKCACGMGHDPKDENAVGKLAAAKRHRDWIVNTWMADHPETRKIEPVHISRKDSIARRLDVAIRRMDEAFDDSETSASASVSDGSELDAE